MEFHRFAPIPPLIPYVQYFWTLANADEIPAPYTFTTIADGLPGLIFQQPVSGWGVQPADGWPICYLYGQTVNPICITFPSGFRAVGVYFRPHALQSIFGLPAFEWTDRCIAMDVLDGNVGASLVEQLLDTPTADRQIGVLADYLCQRIAANVAKLDAEALYAAKLIVSSGGRLQLRELQKELRISERGFHRKFREAIGIPPKLFSRICQFQAAMQQFREGGSHRLTDLAFAHGYADQPHFIRTFKTFVGYSPRHFARAFAEQLPNFPHLIS